MVKIRNRRNLLTRKFWQGKIKVEKMATKKTKEKKIGISMAEYKRFQRLKERQRRTKRLVLELWDLYKGVKY